MRKFVKRIVRAGRLNRVEIASTAACAAVFTLWNAEARGGLALDVLPFFLCLCLACVLAGRLVARVVGGDMEHDFPTVFLFGFLVLNSTLYLLAWASPLSIIHNARLLMGVVLAAQLIWPPAKSTEDRPLGIGPGHLALALALIAATFWSYDAITSEVVLRDGVVIKPWVDSHFHACEIRMFRDARGFSTLEDLRMAGRPVWIYHHASYIIPALVSAATGTSAYLAFGSVLVPVGVVLAALAAYALVRSLWGGGAGIAALVALLLLPDASRHGLVWNPLLGYHWLQQIAPGGLYGVAILASAWLLMFAGCRSGRLSLVVLSFFTTSLAAHFRSHMFVAGALLIWLYPGVFLRGVRWRWKAAWLVLALVAFVVGVDKLQGHHSVPTLRLDASALKRYMQQTVAMMYYYSSREYFSRFTPESPLLHDVFWGSIVLFYGTLGLFGLADLALGLAVLAGKVVRRPLRVELEYALFPLLVTVNYLAMALGLAFDRNSPGHPDELLHRPLVWAYFVASTWAGGMCYRLFIDRPAARDPRVRTGLVAIVLAMLIVPYRMGERVQVGPNWGHQLTFQSFPRGLFECARFLKVHAYRGELVQDSRNDPVLVLSAACEHPAYAIAYFDGKVDSVLSGRIAELETLKNLTDTECIRRYAIERRIRWYVLHPNTRVQWPETLLARPIFSWGGFRVFSFDPTGRER